MVYFDSLILTDLSYPKAKSLGKYTCNTFQDVYKSELDLSPHVTRKNASLKYFYKLKKWKFDEIFTESV